LDGILPVANPRKHNEFITLPSFGSLEIARASFFFWVDENIHNEGFTKERKNIDVFLFKIIIIDDGHILVPT